MAPSIAAPATVLAARARTPQPPELADIPWLEALLPQERERALADLKVVQVNVGELLCRVGRPVTYWFGVIDGLLKMSNDTALGVPITLTGLPPGGWFGEGTVIKREQYRYNIQALRRSLVAGLERRDLPLAARPQPAVQPLHRPPAQRAARPIHRRARDRPARRSRRARRAQPRGALPSRALSGRGLAAANHPAGARLPGRPVAPARQRGAEARSRAAAAIRVEYGGVRVLDLERLRGYGSG